MHVQRITVIGTGTMGNGIAGQAALTGFDVVLYDIDAERVSAAMTQIEKTYDKGIAREKITVEAAAAGRARLSQSAELISAVKDADLVIEAVPERMSLKQEIFSTLERETQAHTILATNTSSLSISEIASATGCADRVIGMHFFNPVAAMKLVELVAVQKRAMPSWPKRAACLNRWGSNALPSKTRPDSPRAAWASAWAMRPCACLRRASPRLLISIRP